ncbi:hypothetical protein Y1Q_0005460 [Alligator mississippiensis]|uniref:Uncharacterized protein n=1 Tax=Alligator mississippiensis TaxID=8496 RepID=A0A151MEM7_ALLMI|nr:hypothetical protein Y1Q_0005460 [Alligator mississippiensis]
MTWATFLHCLEQLHLHLKWQDIIMQQSLPVDIRPIVPASLHYVGYLFGVGKATAREAIFKVGTTLQDVLGNMVLQTKVCLTHYALLLLLTMVPWVHLCTWHGILRFDSAVGKPKLPHNLHRYLEGYLWLCYVFLLPRAKEGIAAGINMFLGT